MNAQMLASLAVRISEADTTHDRNDVFRPIFGKGPCEAHQPSINVTELNVASNALYQHDESQNANNGNGRNTAGGITRP